MAPPAATAGDDSVPLEQLVFSCAICQATPAEVYTTHEGNQGFHNAPGYDEKGGIVTKMWIAECSHITCAIHLENGAAPFHPRGEPPRAACPKCSRDRNDSNPKALYSIRGLKDGEYDPMIPCEWRQCPAIELDSSVPGMSALRFQYMALAHFARQARRNWKSAEEKRTINDAAHTAERKRSSQLQKEIRELNERVRVLEKAEVQCKKWEARKPEIHHYLGVVGEMARDIESMRSELHLLGVDVPTKDYAFHGQGSAGREQNHRQASESSSTRKRKRDHPASRDPDLANAQGARRSSREIMPPPPLRSSPFRQARHDSGLNSIIADGRRAYSDPLGPPQQTGYGAKTQSQYYHEVPSDMQELAAFQDGTRTGNFQALAHFPTRGDYLPRQDLDSAPHRNSPQPRDLRGHLRPYETQHKPTLHAPLLDQHVTSRHGLSTHTPPIPSPSRQQRSHPPVASLFFRRDNLHAPGSPTLRPPTRGSGLQYRHQASTGLDMDAYGSRKVGITSLQQHSDPRASGRTSFFEREHQQTSRHPFYQPFQQLRSQQAPLQSTSMLPQTPRNSRGLFQRPDMYPSRGTYTSMQPQRPNMYHDPRTQAPSSVTSNDYYRPATQASQYEPSFMRRSLRADADLSQLPGVKGLGIRSGFTNASHLGSGYAGARHSALSTGRARYVGR